MKKAESAWLILTNKCNMKCSYCWLPRYSREKQESIMSYETLEKAIYFLRNNCDEGVSICLFGGEPLLEYKSIRKIIDKFPYLNYSIYTNTTLFNDDIIDFFYKHRDFIKIVLSIDGSPEANEKYRGRKYSIEHIKKIYNKFSNVVTRITLIDADNYYDNFKYLYDLGAKKIDTHVPHFIKLSENYFNTLKKQLEKVKSDFPEDVLITRSLTATKEQLSTRFCSCGEEQVIVAPNGDIHPCDLFYWTGKSKIGSVYSGYDDEALTSFLAEKKENSKCIHTSCYAEQLFYKDIALHNFKTIKC